MEIETLGILGALWLGILTSISPCPLAGNIVAISYIGRQLTSSKATLLAGLLYVLGRTAVYVALGILLVASLLKVRSTAIILQEYINIVLGPILVVAGLFLLRVIKFSTGGSVINERLKNRFSSYGPWGAFPLGMIFALSFCPISAALFFGSLIPLAVQNNSSLVWPSIYGIGTGLPVIICAFVLAFGTRYIGRLFDKLTLFEKWASRVTGIIFILGGIYYGLQYIAGVNIY